MSALETSTDHSAWLPITAVIFLIAAIAIPTFLSGVAQHVYTVAVAPIGCFIIGCAAAAAGLVRSIRTRRHRALSVVVTAIDAVLLLVFAMLQMVGEPR